MTLINSINTNLEHMALDELLGHLLHHEIRLEQLAIATEVTLPSANIATQQSNHSG